MTEAKQRLDATNIQLGKELWLIHSSLAIYRVIGLNAKGIPRGDSFFGFVQNQSLSAVALGLGKVFEREQPDGYELCSVGGVGPCTGGSDFRYSAIAARSSGLNCDVFLITRAIEPAALSPSGSSPVSRK